MIPESIRKYLRHKFLHKDNPAGIPVVEITTWNRLEPTSLIQQAPRNARFVDVNMLLEALSTDELNKAADDYFKKHLENSDYYFAKPLGSLDEVSELLIAFAHAVRSLRLLPGMTVLDFGCGTCWSSKWLTQLGAKVISVDVSPSALELGKQLYAKYPVAGNHLKPEFLPYDGHTIDLEDECVDRILCLDAFHHVPNQGEILRELARVIKTGGLASFSEPGPRHAASPQSQSEMKLFTVIENNIVIEDIWPLAEEAGFTKMSLLIYNRDYMEVELGDFLDYLAGGSLNITYAEKTLSYMQDRRAFLLYKGELLDFDSRRREGLCGSIEVTLDQISCEPGVWVKGRATVSNTGLNRWLASGGNQELGTVNVGIHWFGPDQIMRDRDFARCSIPIEANGLLPGERLSFPIRFEAPKEGGTHRMQFDLVSERVCWFESNGTQPVDIELTVKNPY
jgi:2-polyprenyl-3-methyl-5-hydroxy-6-metoxy-1,4-benzoquinol methylase